MRVARWATWGAAAGSGAVAAAPLGYRIGVAPLGPAFLLLAGGLLVIAVSLGVLGARMARGAGLRGSGRQRRLRCGGRGRRLPGGDAHLGVGCAADPRHHDRHREPAGVRGGGRAQHAGAYRLRGPGSRRAAAGRLSGPSSGGTVGCAGRRVPPGPGRRAADGLGAPGDRSGHLPDRGPRTARSGSASRTTS